MTLAEEPEARVVVEQPLVRLVERAHVEGEQHSGRVRGDERRRAAPHSIPSRARHERSIPGSRADETARKGTSMRT